MKTIIFSFLVWSAIVIRSPIRAAVVLSEDIKDLLPQQNSVAWKESLFVWRIPLPTSLNNWDLSQISIPMLEHTKNWKFEATKYLKNLWHQRDKKFMEYFSVDNEDEDSRGASWPGGHWCRDNVSLGTPSEKKRDYVGKIPRKIAEVIWEDCRGYMGFWFGIFIGPESDHWLCLSLTP